ncbi:MAG: hypothetical protein ABJD97_08765 [Betaproteobacteria bacterium]
MNDHVAKPIRLEELFSTLARWIRPAAFDPEPRSPDPVDGWPHVDHAAGVAGSMGDETMYLRLLRMFRDREADFP